MIKIENLSKKFGTKVVLKDVNIEFSEGKIYGIIGENGAGKTTLFNCIFGLETYKGNIYSDVSLRSSLGFAMTDPYFMASITGREYIRLICNGRGKKI